MEEQATPVSCEQISFRFINLPYQRVECDYSTVEKHGKRFAQDRGTELQTRITINSLVLCFSDIRRILTRVERIDDVGLKTERNYDDVNHHDVQ